MVRSQRLNGRFEKWTEYCGTHWGANHENFIEEKMFNQFWTSSHPVSINVTIYQMYSSPEIKNRTIFFLGSQRTSNKEERLASNSKQKCGSVLVNRFIFVSVVDLALCEKWLAMSMKVTSNLQHNQSKYLYSNFFILSSFERSFIFVQIKKNLLIFFSV